MKIINRKQSSLLLQKKLSEDLVGKFTERLIRTMSGGFYVHVEFACDDVEHGHTVETISACRESGKVRKKLVTVDDRFDILVIPVDSTEPWKFLESQVGKKYDHIGVMLTSTVFPVGVNRSKWFCSELVGAALGVPDPQHVSPQRLHDLLMWKYDCEKKTA